jgi:hypothetical protein
VLVREQAVRTDPDPWRRTLTVLAIGLFVLVVIAAAAWYAIHRGS